MTKRRDVRSGYRSNREPMSAFHPLQPLALRQPSSGRAGIREQENGGKLARPAGLDLRPQAWKAHGSSAQSGSIPDGGRATFSVLAVRVSRLWFKPRPETHGFRSASSCEEDFHHGKHISRNLAHGPAAAPFHSGGGRIRARFCLLLKVQLNGLEEAHAKETRPGEPQSLSSSASA
jgi:hypothetical protein